MSLGSVLKFGREQKGWTRKFLAELIGVNINSIAKYERAGEPSGQFPPFPTLSKLVLVLGLRPSVVLSEGLEDANEKSAMLNATVWQERVSELMEIYEDLNIHRDELEKLIFDARTAFRDIIGSIDIVDPYYLDKHSGESKYAFFKTEEVQSKLKEHRQKRQRAQEKSAEENKLKNRNGSE